MLFIKWASGVLAVGALAVAMVIAKPDSEPLSKISQPGMSQSSDYVPEYIPASQAKSQAEKAEQKLLATSMTDAVKLAKQTGRNILVLQYGRDKAGTLLKKRMNSHSMKLVVQNVILIEKEAVATLWEQYDSSGRLTSSGVPNAKTHRLPQL